MKSSVHLRFLGTGNAFSESGDRCASNLLYHSGYLTLLDCGPSILQALYCHDIRPSDLNTIYISHLHPDHYFGLLFLGLHHQYIPPLKSIQVFGPPGIQTKVLEAARVMYSQAETERMREIFEFHEFAIGERVTFQGGTFEAIPAMHQANARMVIVDLDGYKIGYSGDTSIHLPSLEYLFETCNAVIHEATTYDLYVPYHTMLKELLEVEIPKDIQFFITHHDNSVVKWIAQNQVPSNIYLARDDDIVELCKEDDLRSLKEAPLQKEATASGSFDSLLGN